MSLDPRWQRVQELVAAAETRPEAERHGWLEVIESDPALRSEAQQLLIALEAEAAANRRSAAHPTPRHPESIGPYTVLEAVGSGGRGTVYRAVRDVAGGSQQVALKRLRDPLTTPELLDRFQREQRILAGLSHHAIARFFDAGVDGAGHPYLVLEWIDGQPLHHYAASLPLAERVRLIVQVLDALQAAHQSLVVHLDIKPSNILVDRSGNVRLIDFGTAKLLSAEGAATETRQLTPSYASPEQLRGEPVSTATDIYSTALTLLELVHPRAFAPSSLVALAERATAETAEVHLPQQPDLEAILRKALRFFPAQRYRSAAEFADDLRAWLDQRPVRARRATPLYRLQRFAQRNWRSLSVAALIGVVMMGLALYGVQQQRERLREAERASAIADFLRGMITTSATAASGNAQLSVLDMLDRAHQRLENGAAVPPEVAALLQADFAYYARESGREEQAQQYARAAMRRADSSNDPVARLVSRQTLAEIVLRLGNCEQAVALFREADSILPAASLKPLPEVSYLAARAAAKSRCEAQPAGAVLLLERALARSALVTASPAALPPAVLRASLHNSLALELGRLHRFPEARTHVARGLQQAQAHPDARYFLVSLRRILGQIESNAERHAESLAAYEQALSLAPGVATPFEQLRLQLLAAGQQADLGLHQAAIQRTRSTVERIDAKVHGTARWMLLADAAEVMARAQACPDALQLYARVDEITAGKIPRDWHANRLTYTALCTADPNRAAELARQARDAYGSQLRPDSPRSRLLQRLTATR